MITRNPAQSARCWPYANLLLPKPPDGTISSSMGPRLPSSHHPSLSSPLTPTTPQDRTRPASLPGRAAPDAISIVAGSPADLPAMSAAFKAFLNSPVGPKTTHFWGPVSNWGIILAVRCTHHHHHCSASARGSICVARARRSPSRRGDLELQARVASLLHARAVNTTRLMGSLT